MSTIDWIVLSGTLGLIVFYGLWKSRGSGSVSGFLLANRSMRWYTVAFAIMATQASAITFTSTPGQAYTDGLRFIQFYFGLPIAMVILCITAVPVYHKLGVYTAYEYIERRFDAKTRVLTTLLFLVSRGLAAGMTIYAPSLLLSIMLGIDVRVTSLIIGGVVIVYTAAGGVKAVNYTDTLQFAVILGGMAAAFAVAVSLLPSGVSAGGALSVAAAAGRLNAIDFSFDITNRYNFWSGLIGGAFVALAYFGTDQSQVQRYLTGRSVADSRLALLWNGLMKVPMQFFILLLGVMVFAFYQFTQPPLSFNPNNLRTFRDRAPVEEVKAAEARQQALFLEKEAAARAYLRARDTETPERQELAREKLAGAHAAFEHGRAETAAAIKRANPGADGNDTNYIFLSFVLGHLPAGLIGLLFACIFLASMSSSSGELSALASISVIDLFKRFIRPQAEERTTLLVSRAMMIFWGLYAVVFAQYAAELGSLVEAVNILGSLFYGTMLGVFLLAFYAKRVDGTAVCWGAAAGETAVLLCFKFTSIAWLWYNVIGTAIVVLAGLALSYRPGKSAK